MTSARALHLISALFLGLPLAPIAAAQIVGDEEFAAGNDLELSKANPGKYVTLYACFGLFVRLDDHLHVHAPTDSVGGSYWLNGRAHPFTDSQHGADQRATPALS